MNALIGQSACTTWQGELRILDSVFLREFHIHEGLCAFPASCIFAFRAVEEMLESSLTEKTAHAPSDDIFADDILRDPKVRKQAKESLQKQVEAWVYQKIPVLGNRTPVQAVREPEGKEIVESLLLEWERQTEGGLFPSSIQPDIQAVRKLLDLDPPARG